MNTSFHFWCRWLFITAVIFAAQGLMWALIGDFDPFGFYTSQMAQSFFGSQTLSSETQKVFAFILAPFGATDAGFFVLIAFLAHYPLRQREEWSYKAVVSGIFVWFFVDTGMSLVHGAYFNVFLVNLPAIAILGLPLIMIRRYMVRQQEP